MSNKSRLQANNINLQSLIDKANELPDAGSGESIETCTIEINHYGQTEPLYSPSIISYTTLDDSGNISASIMGSSGDSLHEKSPIVLSNVVCGSALSIYISGAVSYSISNIELIDVYNSLFVFKVNTDATITFTPM